MPIEWTSYPLDPSALVGLREHLLQVLFTPWLLSLLLGALVAFVCSAPAAVELVEPWPDCGRWGAVAECHLFPLGN